MELTPLKIRGKRQRRKGDPPLPPKPPSMSKKADRERRIRRIMLKKQQKAKPKPQASYLEKELPLEIIERIFWASENVNFAKSSLRVGRLLSGPATRRATFLHAFGPTWDVWFGCLRSGPEMKSYHGWQDDVARFGGSPGFQVRMLLSGTLGSGHAS